MVRCRPKEEGIITTMEIYAVHEPLNTYSLLTYSLDAALTTNVVSLKYIFIDFSKRKGKGGGREGGRGRKGG